MATLTSPHLTIATNNPPGKSKITVTGEIHWSSLEKFHLEHDLVKYRLECFIKGADWPDPDDTLFQIRPKKYPSSGSVSQTTPYTFVQENVSNDRLDEDESSEDEIFAHIVLVNLEDNSRKRINSNKIDFNFG